MQEMQNKVFKLGFGPIPYYRRPGVLVHISPLHKDHNERSKFKLGVIVAHRPGMHGCKYGVFPEHDEDEHRDVNMAGDDGNNNNNPLQQDECCYFCQDNPFYEVCFTSNNHDENCGESSSSCRRWRIQQERVQERVLPMGTRLLLKASALERMMPGFVFAVRLILFVILTLLYLF